MLKFLNPSKSTNSGKTNLVQFDWGEDGLRTNIRIYPTLDDTVLIYMIYESYLCVCTVYTFTFCTYIIHWIVFDIGTYLVDIHI